MLQLGVGFGRSAFNSPVNASHSYHVGISFPFLLVLVPAEVILLLLLNSERVQENFDSSKSKIEAELLKKPVIARRGAVVTPAPCRRVIFVTGCKCNSYERQRVLLVALALPQNNQLTASMNDSAALSPI